MIHYPNTDQERHGKPGTILTEELQLGEQEFLFLDGGSNFIFKEVISFIIHCRAQDEIDYYWNLLKKCGDENAQQGAWLKNKFGASW